MPRHSKYDKAKRHWYKPVPEGKQQKSEMQKLFKFALFHDWELRPQVLGVWVMSRKRIRLFVTYDESGNKFQDCVMVIAGKGDDVDEERKLNRKQMVLVLKKRGRLYDP